MKKDLGFFEIEENRNLLKDFVRIHKSDKKSEEFEDRIKFLSVKVAEDIISYPKEWSSSCAITINNLGLTLINILNNFNKPYGKSIERSFTIFLQLTCEFLFRNPSFTNSNNDIYLIKEFAEDHLFEFKSGFGSSVMYSLYALPADLIKYALQSPDMSLLKDFYKGKKDLEDINEVINSAINSANSKINEVNEIQKTLDKQKTLGIFVGLNEAFKNLKIAKDKEASINYLTLLCIGTVMIFIPVILLISYFFIDFNQRILILAPVLSLELILIYLFRVVLVRFKEIKTQIMQLELRQALCQFIQNYVDYSSEIKAKDSAALEKFENLIFSGITSNPENIPSTFDGIDQIARLIQSVKNSK